MGSLVRNKIPQSYNL